MRRVTTARFRSATSNNIDRRSSQRRDCSSAASVPVGYPADELPCKDKWWPLNDDQTPAEIVGKVEAHVLPFLERMHTREAMKQWPIDNE
jgi:hypothetical protein